MRIRLESTYQHSEGFIKSPNRAKWTLMAERVDGILLDASVVVANLRGRIDLQSLAAANEPLFLPLVAFGELYRGVLKSARSESNRAKVYEFLEIAAVLSPDVATADIYARIAEALEVKGTPIPENDIWIAAVALECEMPLATRDDHFRQVDKLDILWW